MTEEASLTAKNLGYSGLNSTIYVNEYLLTKHGGYFIKYDNTNLRTTIVMYGLCIRKCFFARTVNLKLFVFTHLAIYLRIKLLSTCRYLIFFYEIKFY